MSYSICLIDDQIPASQVKHFDDTELISSSMLKYLLNEDIKWNESELKSLVSELFKNENISLVSAFNNPTFFFNYSNEASFTPQAIVYDYNYHGLETNDSKDLLKRILKETFTVVFIYTRIDQSHEIEEMITGQEFKEYSNRLFLIHKEDEDSVKNLISGLDSINEENFSFKFGQILKNTSNLVLNNILSELGRVSVSQFGHYFQLASEDRRDFVEFLGERFKNQLVESDSLDNFDFNKGLDGEADEDLGPNIWSYRLYNYERRDERVRKGDIVKKENKIYLVISADCDLNDHMKKNYGYVIYVPLYEINEENDYLIKQICLNKEKKHLKKSVEKNPKYFSVSSLTNSVNGLSGGPVLLPYLKDESELKNYVVFPKEITSDYFNLDGQDKHEKFLRYNDSFDFTKVASISEPFKTPLIQHVLNTIGGYGVPDYPKGVKEELSHKIGELFS